MRPNILLAAFIVAIMSLATAIAATASVLALPDDQTVEYRIRETPTDPDSLIVFYVIMDLTASDSAGNQIGWEITEMEFRQPSPPGPAPTIWVEDWPVVDSPDGLWWIEHEDPQNPAMSEFVMPPLLNGTAYAADPSDPDLAYDLQGVVYTPPPGETPFNITAALDYEFTLVGEEEPIEEGDDEPVDIADGVNDPH